MWEDTLDRPWQRIVELGYRQGSSTMLDTILIMSRINHFMAINLFDLRITVFP